jgi:lysophospholipase L1-like esterase
MKFSNGFSHNPFMMGYDSHIYEGDENLGFIFPKRKIITSSGFTSLEKLMKEIKLGDKVVVNLGDSSTSGWNSNKVHKGNRDSKAPFFSYKTYSQLMEEQSDLMVVNAGVPGYSSLQGKKYLEQLLKKLASESIGVDYVTVYFGNNDVTCNQYEDKVRLDRKKATQENDGSRVSVEDYKRNIRDVIESARDYGTEAILIMPVVHYDWEPGIRSDQFREEFKEALNRLEDDKVRQDLESAVDEYKIGNYERALELDQVLPRIKVRYQQALREVAEEMQVPLIDVQVGIPRTNNAEYFADYCHPLEPTNQMITDIFFKITGIEKGQRKARGKDRIPLRYRILEGVVNFLGYFIRPGKNKSDSQPPDDIYTLH